MEEAWRTLFVEKHKQGEHPCKRKTYLLTAGNLSKEASKVEKNYPMLNYANFVSKHS